MRTLERLTRACDPRGFSLVETLTVAAISITAAAVVVPVTLSTIASFRASGDAHAIGNHIANAKMRAAANFTLSRLYVDLNANSFHVDVWRKSGVPGWVTEGGVETLGRGDAFSLGGLTAPPPNTQVALAQAPPCTDDLGNAIANTACVVFNSRGIPIDATGVATASDALYITGAGGVYGTTLSATSRVQLWWSKTGTAAWMRKQ